MSNAGPGASDVFDVRKVRRLVELMDEFELSELDLRQGDQRIRLRRGNLAAAAELAAASHAARSPAPAPPSAAAAAGGSTANTANLVEIKSPMVGTFYAAPAPDAPPYVKVGDHVGPDTTVCIIEAMKVFNEIPAEVSGRIVAVLVSRGDPVEFGQPLFRVAVEDRS
jgi:acetyl-CoA carboxylase biotin carboxyl carrier protein